MSSENECRTYGSKSKHCNKNDNKEMADSILVYKWTKEKKQIKKIWGFVTNITTATIKRKNKQQILWLVTNIRIATVKTNQNKQQ